MGGFIVLAVFAGFLVRGRRTTTKKQQGGVSLRALKSTQGCLTHLWAPAHPIATSAIADFGPEAKLVAGDLGDINIANGVQRKVLELWIQLLQPPVIDDPEAYVRGAVTMENARQIAQQYARGCTIPARPGAPDRDVLRSIRDLGLVALAHVRGEYVLNPFDRI